MYKPFEALSEFMGDRSLDTVTVNPNPVPPDDKEIAMMLMGKDEWIYITKEQAMKFFGLLDPNETGSCYDPEGYPPNK